MSGREQTWRTNRLSAGRAKLSSINRTNCELLLTVRVKFAFMEGVGSMHFRHRSRYISRELHPTLLRQLRPG